TLPSNTITNPKEELKGITTRSGVAYKGPTIPTLSKQGTEVTKYQVQTPSSQSTAPVQPLVSQSETPTLISEPVVAPVSALMPNVKSSIPYPSRRDDERRRDQANKQIKKFYVIFKDMSFEISFTDALILMPKFASTLKSLIGNKEKLSEMARTSINEHCSAVILNKLTRKLGDPGKFLIPCEFPRMDECLALADLGASINLMPLSVDFLFFEEADAFLGLEDDPNLPKINPFFYDPKGDILLLEAILNSEPLPPLPNHEQYFPSFKKELKVCEAKTVKSSVDEPPEVELKDLPPNLEYAFLEGDNKLPVIIAKELGDEEKSALIKVLKSHKRAITWKLSDIQGINPEFCTHKTGNWVKLSDLKQVLRGRQPMFIHSSSSM
nr:reverse transcriptase domain-containing protein [Tanacetum cinerariifolium]